MNGFEFMLILFLLKSILNVLKGGLRFEIASTKHFHMI